MGSIVVNEQVVTFPDPPYQYDDSRIVYDEPCLFYDGGFSTVCLINLFSRPPKKVGRGAGFKPSKNALKKKEECRTILDIIIKAGITKVNDRTVNEKHLNKKYHLDYGPIEISIERIKHDEREINVHMQNITSSIAIPKVCIADKNIKLLPIKTIVSSSATRIKKPKLIFKTETMKKKK